MNRKFNSGFLFACCVVFSSIALLVFAEDTKTSGLTDTLIKSLSLKPEQATGAAGSVFAFAKTKMPETDFTKLASGFPEMDTLLKAAPKPTGAMAATSALTNQSGAMTLANQFNNLGISPEIAAKVVPEILNFVKGKQGTEVMELLSKAVK